ncbi:HD-GYP domain, c-di-GMP phosphodiesterase class II (or its inactivated variant) [Marinospirillum celere]|uniref:HD-GYP domain, c-di-GMP phosphodiesterase class II (Or its inactivated variant) n=1 Tax=Marinospirillum celere TaxID=1122252 RepID=A0A1I1ES67_9GAMM|nr:HD domain-containing phosphohydrolase [Marinospirillum celere]SFB89496.1 HD-GYP domain, c-di-GMP phosphodiesterase class II (or its inactivated variant) [Marinospirillum celere]
MLIDNNQELYPLEEEELELGMELPWTVYTEAGQLLMREGSQVDNQRKLDNLLSKGYRHREKKASDASGETAPDPTEPQPVLFDQATNPFSELDELGYQLKQLFELIEEDKARPGQVEKRCYALATQVQGLIELNADAVLGAVHMSSEHPYIIQHPLHVTIIAALVAKTLKVPQPIQLSMLAASLTQNIGMNAYQMRLHAQKEPLSKQQRAQVEEHPLEGVKLLSKAGVMDRLWLQIVYQHHEKTDGKGYPKGLKGVKIRPEARILALGDVYAALVTGRPYRPGLSAQQSLRSIFLARGKQFDPKLSQVFLSELGLYPPGASVRLRNGEVAIVIERTKDTRAPKVTSFMDSHGQLFMRMQQRDTSEFSYNVVAGVNPQSLPRLNPTLLWGIKLRRVN